MPQQSVSPRWRIAFFATLFVALVATGCLLYSVIDQAITLTYMSDGYERTKADLRNLANAYPRDQYNKKDIVAVLRRNDANAFIVETACAVQLNGLRFEFDKNGKLININTRAEQAPEYECGI